MTFQLAVLILTLLTLATMIIIVAQNHRVTKVVKMRFILAYTIIGLAALAEWASDMLEGASKDLIWMHYMFKYLDLVLTPGCAVFLVRQVSTEKISIRHKIIYLFLGLHWLYEFIAMFTGWTFYIDENNFYHDGFLYLVYVFFYCAMIFCVLFDFINYSKNFQKRNLASLFFIIALGTAAGLLTEIRIPGVNIRVTYIGLAIAASLLYIHYNEYAANKITNEYMKQISISLTDALTGLQNRTAYNEKLVELKDKPEGEEFIIYAIDVNGLKKTNDTLGHTSGDELIVAVANIIYGVFGQRGNCYRVGGDEFAVITENNNENPMVLSYEFRDRLSKFHSKNLHSLSASIGFAKRSECPDYSVEQVANLADMNMYKSKHEYYKNNKKQ